MNKIINNNKGITLMALIITIIVLSILTAIGIGSATGMKGSITQSKEVISTTELSKIQQAILENYVKYKQLNQERFLKGDKITFDEANKEFKKLGVDESQKLKVASYDGVDGTDPSLFYYKLDKMHLKELGLQNINDDDMYIVNYSSGEVFNITQKKSINGTILYIYGKEIN